MRVRRQFARTSFRHRGPTCLPPCACCSSFAASGCASFATCCPSRSLGPDVAPAPPLAGPVRALADHRVLVDRARPPDALLHRRRVPSLSPQGRDSARFLAGHFWGLFSVSQGDGTLPNFFWAFLGQFSVSQGDGMLSVFLAGCFWPRLSCPAGTGLCPFFCGLVFAA